MKSLLGGRLVVEIMPEVVKPYQTARLPREGRAEDRQ